MRDRVFPVRQPRANAITELITRGGTEPLLQQFQRDFLNLALERGALKFGEFTLKSGRISPYFFNAGAFSDGAALATLGRCYADCIAASELEIELLFGPAYKGIPLAAATAVALADAHSINLPYCFNRKEAKAHGEGGSIVGASLSGKALVIDDVITAGTAVREVMAIIAEHGASCAGVLIGLNRQERGKGELSAIQEVEAEYGVPVLSIVSLADIVTFIEESGGDLRSHLPAMEAYRERYGVS